LQETIFELARSKGVITAALNHVGPPRGYRRPSQWPTVEDVADFRKQINITPLNGAEFGKTEVFFLSVRDLDREWAAKTVAALCDELDVELGQLHQKQARSMTAELENSVHTSERDLEKHTLKLSAFEAQVGADLSELRSLASNVGTSSTLAQEQLTIESERRSNEAQRRTNRQLAQYLVAAQQAPDQILAMPASLLASQPALQQLKSALVEAQVRTSTQLGRRTENHPAVRTARKAEESIRRQLRAELSAAVAGIKIDLKLNDERETELAARAEAGRQRLANLADLRAQYSGLVAAV
jgi:uncharacterized protein involved in exopolysaccharide biosynthesis